MNRKMGYLSAALAGSLAILGTAVPAEATVYHGCGVSAVCLYQALNYGQERWASSLNNIHLHTSGGVTSCLNLAPATWSNGTPVTDNTAGLVVNNETDPAWTHFDVYFFNWINCNPDGPYDGPFEGGTIPPGAGVTELGDLRPVHYPSTTISLYHTITSIEVIPH